MIVISSVLLAGLIAMTVLLFINNHKKNVYLDLSKRCMTSYSTAIDYIMCEEDYRLGNIKYDTCKWFEKDVLADVEFVRSINYTANYTYIWTE